MNDLLSDLQADLAPARSPLPSAPLPVAAPVRRTTPAFELRLTPLRWSLPGVGLDEGVCLRVGPLQVGLTRR